MLLARRPAWRLARAGTRRQTALRGRRPCGGAASRLLVYRGVELTDSVCLWMLGYRIRARLGQQICGGRESPCGASWARRRGRARVQRDGQQRPLRATGGGGQAPALARRGAEPWAGGCSRSVPQRMSAGRRMTAGRVSPTAPARTPPAPPPGRWPWRPSMALPAAAWLTQDEGSTPKRRASRRPPVATRLGPGAPAACPSPACLLPRGGG